MLYYDNVGILFKLLAFVNGESITLQQLCMSYFSTQSRHVTYFWNISQQCNAIDKMFSAGDCFFPKYR